MDRFLIREDMGASRLEMCSLEDKLVGRIVLGAAGVKGLTRQPYSGRE